MGLWDWLFHRRQREAELDEEVQGHLRMAAQERIEQGEPAEQARVSAVREFGNVTLVKEVTRDMWGFHWLETLLQDLRYSLRQLKRNPGFAALTVLILALGIGANIALFSVMNVMLLRALPVRNPQELVELDRLTPDGNLMPYLTPAEFEHLHKNASVLSGIFAFIPDTRVLASSVGTERVSVQKVSGSFFPTLGVKALLGRAIDSTDDRPDTDHQVVVLSYRFWSSHFGRDPAVVGATLHVSGAPDTVIGVMPADFFGVDPSQYPKMWVPLASNPKTGIVSVLGRLMPGVSIPQARAQLQTLFRQALEVFVDSRKNWPEQRRKAVLGEKLLVNHASRGTPGLRWEYWEYSNTLKILIAMTGLVLLITCLNVANLLMARSAARSREISIRLAIGAGRSRILRQLLTENLLVALLGGVVGLLVAVFAHRVLVTLLVGNLQDVALDFRLDERVLGFSLSISILAGLLSGVLPALRAGHWGRVPPPQDALPLRGVTRLPFARSLLTIQLALSLTLLISAGLFVRTLRNLASTNLGIAHENLVLMSVDPSLSKSIRDRRKFWRQLTGRLDTLPGVVSVSLAGRAVFGNGVSSDAIRVRQPDGTEHATRAGFNEVGPGFFSTVGTPLLAGREFGVMDQPDSPPVAVVNRALAREFFGEHNPVGKRFGITRAGSSSQIEIVGVIGDAKYNLRQQPPPMFYMPLFQNFNEVPYYVHVKVSGNPSAVTAAIRREIKAMDQDISVDDVRTINEVIDLFLQQDRMFAVLASVFGMLALLLTSLGIYGAVAYQITRRTGEVGIRMALGAQRRNVLWMFMRETLLVLAAGASIGLPAAVAAGHLLRSLLFGLKPSDPVTIIWATVTLVGTGALAGFLPARRAASLLPMDALRHE